MARSVLAVVGGFLLIGALAFGGDAIAMRAFPHLFDAATGTSQDPRVLVGLVLWVFAVATFGCWLAARVAPNRPMRHAMILGVAGLVFNVAGTIAMWDTAPAWYHVVSLLLVLPAAYLGGLLASRQPGASARRATA